MLICDGVESCRQVISEYFKPLAPLLENTTNIKVKALLLTMILNCARNGKRKGRAILPLVFFFVLTVLFLERVLQKLSDSGVISSVLQLMEDNDPHVQEKVSAIVAMLSTDSNEK